MSLIVQLYDTSYAKAPRTLILLSLFPENYQKKKKTQIVSQGILEEGMLIKTKLLPRLILDLSTIYKYRKICAERSKKGSNSVRLFDKLN